MRRLKIGLALGCGGARGFAHVGVLKSLEKHKIPIDLISGSSIGSLIGALYAADPDAKKLEKLALNNNYKLFDYRIPSYGLIKGEKIRKFIQNNTNNFDFNDLKIPLIITSYDLKNNREILFKKGNVADAVMASIAIPGLFPTVNNKNYSLVDGGLIDPIPIKILRKSNVDKVIAVNVNSIKINKTIENNKLGFKRQFIKTGIFQNIFNSFQILLSLYTSDEAKKNSPDFLLNINLQNQRDFDFKNIKKSIFIGEKYTDNFIKKNKKLSDLAI